MVTQLSNGSARDEQGRTSGKKRIARITDIVINNLSLMAASFVLTGKTYSRKDSRLGESLRRPDLSSTSEDKSGNDIERLFLWYDLQQRPLPFFLFSYHNQRKLSNVRFGES
jgi:hypothetical protein